MRLRPADARGPLDYDLIVLLDQPGLVDLVVPHHELFWIARVVAREAVRDERLRDLVIHTDLSVVLEAVLQWVGKLATAEELLHRDHAKNRGHRGPHVLRLQLLPSELLLSGQKDCILKLAALVVAGGVALAFFKSMAARLVLLAVALALRRSSSRSRRRIMRDEVDEGCAYIV